MPDRLAWPAPQPGLIRAALTAIALATAVAMNLTWLSAVARAATGG